MVLYGSKQKLDLNSGFAPSVGAELCMVLTPGSRDSNSSIKLASVLFVAQPSEKDPAGAIVRRMCRFNTGFPLILRSFYNSLEQMH